ncbi:hypothetical protein BZA77DRAFT_323823, partial [Pyronema omphalodes]
MFLGLSKPVLNEILHLFLTLYKGFLDSCLILCHVLLNLFKNLLLLLGQGVLHILLDIFFHLPKLLLNFVVSL